MQTLICQSCGNILRGNNPSCSGCGGFVSLHAATALPPIVPQRQALAAVVKPDPLQVERLLAKVRAIGQPNGNGGNGHGNGHDLSAGEATGNFADFAPQSVPEQPQAPTWPVEPASHDLEKEASPSEETLKPPEDISLSQAEKPLPPTEPKVSATPVKRADFFETAPPPVAPKINLGDRTATADFFSQTAIEQAVPSSSLPSTNIKEEGKANENENEAESTDSSINQPASQPKERQERPHFFAEQMKQVNAEAAEKALEKMLDSPGVDHASEQESPHRRSFSGKEPTSPLVHQVIDHNHDHDDHHDDEHDDHTHDPFSAKAKRFFQAEASFLGFKLRRQTFAIILVVLLVVVPNLFSAVSTIVGSGGNIASVFSPPPDIPLLTGKWVIDTNNIHNRLHGRMLIQQTGSHIDGEGYDVQPFRIQGEVSRPDNLTFFKYYIMRDGSFGKPVEFHGRFQLGQSAPYVKGTWTFQKRQGIFYKARSVTYSDTWQAQQTQVMSHVNLKYSSNTGERPASLPQPSHESQANLYMKVAGGLLVAGAVLVWVSWQTFGTNGILSIFGKQQYIPSQYKNEHRKILGQLSKPLKPGGVPLGRRCEWKAWLPFVTKDLSLPPEIRKSDPHMLILGAGDKGKTRLMAYMIGHDIEANDRAVVVIDSDGDLVDMLTRWIAHHHKGKQLAKRVVLLDPTYKSGSLAYNPLEAPQDGDLQSAASSVVYGFKAIYTEPPGSQSQWNAQTANILRNSALLLMANGKTLVDLPTLLQDNDFRDILLESVERKKSEKVEYGTLLDTWGQYKRLARTDQWINWVEPILNRVGPMLSDPRIRPILTKAEADIKLRTVIEEKRVLLVKIAKGQLDQNANLLGGLLVTGLKQAAMSLAGQGKKKPVALYLDEFDNFIEKETLDAITSETEKFQIGFVGAAKTLQHLPEDFRNQLTINIGTMACFALAKKDGDLLGPQMFRVDGRKIKHQTMSNFFNPVNTSPQFELISDEEKLNIDRVVGQDARKFYCYRVGSQAGVFHMESHDFKDIADKDINWKLMERMHGVNPALADKGA